MHQLRQVRRLETEPVAGHCADEHGARFERGIVHLAAAAVLPEVLRVFRCQERALVMIEPPGEVGITGIFEIYNGVFVAIEKLVLEKLRSFMRHAGVHELRAGMKNAFHEAAEESRRRRAVEAMIVIKDAYAHGPARMENLLECTKRAGNATDYRKLIRTARGCAETIKIPRGE